MGHTVVFLDRASLKAKVRTPARAESYVEHEKTSADEVVAKLQGATVAITNKVALRAEALAQLPQLKMIAVAATGYDVVDVPYCKAHGIAVANIRNYAVHTVPEHAFAMILALRRNLLAYRADVEAGVWQKADQFCFFTHDIGDCEHVFALVLVVEVVNASTKAQRTERGNESRGVEVGLLTSTLVVEAHERHSAPTSDLSNEGALSSLSWAEHGGDTHSVEGGLDPTYRVAGERGHPGLFRKVDIGDAVNCT